MMVDDKKTNPNTVEEKNRPCSQFNRLHTEFIFPHTKQDKI